MNAVYPPKYGEARTKPRGSAPEGCVVYRRQWSLSNGLLPSSRLHVFKTSPLYPFHVAPLYFSRSEYPARR